MVTRVADSIIYRQTTSKEESKQASLVKVKRREARSARTLIAVDLAML